MSRFAKITAINLAVFGVLVVAYFIFMAKPVVPSSPEEAASSPTVSSDPPEKDEDRPIIDAYDLTKNPFKLKDQYVVLDTGHMPMLGYADTVRATIGMKGIRFKQMLNDGLAIYSVLAAVDNLSGDEVEELAVDLPDNNPPDASKPWLVLVEGTADGTNGFGAKIQTANVKFIRYAVLPSPPPVIPGQGATPDPAPAPPSQTPAEAQPAPIGEPSVSPEPAPIIRMTPQTLADGDIVFSNPSGCKAILSRMLPNGQVQYVATFEDGTTGHFSAEELEKAGTAAAEHCRGTN